MRTTIVFYKMPYKDPVKQKEKAKEYYDKNKERLKDKQQEYYENNKDNIKIFLVNIVNQIGKIWENKC